MEEVTGAARLPSGARLAFLSEDRRFWPWASLVLGALAVMKGLRPPNRWAATEALVNYDQGLTKRGLFGATLGRWLHLEHYARFALVSYALLVLFFVLLVWFTRASGMLRREGWGPVVAVYASSFSLTYQAHVVGYFDILLECLTLGLLLVRGPRLRFALALPVSVCAVLVHEMFLLAYLPVVLFSFLVDALRTNDRRERSEALVMALLLALVDGGVVLRLAAERPMTSAQLAALIAMARHRADFPLRMDFFEVMQRSLLENLQYTPQIGLFFPLISLFISLPMLLMLGWAFRHAVTQGMPRHAWSAAAAGFGVVIVAPLLLNFLGVDSSRWDELTCLDAFLALLVLVRGLRGTELPPLPAAYRNAAVLMIAVSMITGETLMDGVPVRMYPFAGPVQGLVQKLSAHHLAAPAQ